MYDTYKCTKDFKVFHKNGEYMGFYDEEIGYTIYSTFGGEVIVSEEDFIDHFMDITED